MALRSAVVVFPKARWRRQVSTILRRKPACESGPITRRSSYNSTFKLVYSQHGDPEKVLSGVIEPVARPPLGTNVVVQMMMAPVNPSDLDMIAGSYFTIQELPELPATAGNEGVGRVLEIGSDVKNLRPGDWVIPSEPLMGTWQTLPVWKEEKLTKLDKYELPVLGAATLAVTPCTAFRIMRGILELNPGDVIIQNNANSSVGHAVIQLAKAWGFITVNVIKTTNRVEEDIVTKRLKILGADHVLNDTFLRSPAMKYFVRALRGPVRFGMDHVNSDVAHEMKRHMVEDGILVTYGAKRIDIETDCEEEARRHYMEDFGSASLEFKQVMGYWECMWNPELGRTPTMHEMTSEICDLMRTGRFQPPDAEVYTFNMFPLALLLAKDAVEPRRIALRIDDSGVTI